MDDAIETERTPVEHRVTPSDLVAALDGRAPRVGDDLGDWPGLVVRRFTVPGASPGTNVAAPSLSIVAQGREAVVVGDDRLVYEPLHYLVLTRGAHPPSMILDASADVPFLSLVLPIDPVVARRVARRAAPPPEPSLIDAERDAPGARPRPSPVGGELLDALVRFLRAIESPADRGALAPLYLEEIAYRAMRREAGAALLPRFEQETDPHPLSTVVEYIHRNLAGPIAVADLAVQASLSPSAFTALFRTATGRSPYQFVKQARLERARTLLAEGRHDVGAVARAVGYSSASHFIKEFRGAYRLTPRAYATRVGGREAIVPPPVSEPPLAIASR